MGEWVTPFEGGVAECLEIHPSTTCVSLQNLFVLQSNASSVYTITEIRLKNLTLASRLSRSLKVIGTDTDRSATYMTSYQRSIATLGLSLTVSEINGDFSRKSPSTPADRVFSQRSPQWTKCAKMGNEMLEMSTHFFPFQRHNTHLALRSNVLVVALSWFKLVSL